MKTSEAINELATALAAAQGEMNNAALSKVNPHFRSRYADLASVRDATIPALSKHKLAITQSTGFDADGSFILTTRLLHASGQWIEGTYPLPLMPDKPQVMGSSQTYAKRYSWASIVGIAADEDDDATAAQDAGPRKSSARAKKDGDWEHLQHEMTDARSALSLQRLWDDYRQREYSTWPPAWRQQAEELFEHRMAEFSAQDLGEVLEDSLEAELPKPEPVFAPNARKRAKAKEVTEFDTPTAVQVNAYRERATWLKGATTMQELKTRGGNLEHLSECEKLTVAQRNNLRELYREQSALLIDKEAAA
jgi:hypothetical protein